jgi:hypothetical protein
MDVLLARSGNYNTFNVDQADTSHYALMARNQDNEFTCLPARLLLQRASTINIQLSVLDIITISSKIICSRSMIHSLTY